MFRNMKIATKLIIAFCAVALISSISGITGLTLLTSTNENYSSALENNGFVLGDIGDYNANLNLGGALVRDIITMTDPDDIKAAQEELEQAKANTQAALDDAILRCQTPAEQEILKRINEAAPKYQEARDRAIALGLENKNDEALEVFRTEARPYLKECTTGGQELMALNVEMGLTTSTNLSNQGTMGVILMLSIALIALVVAIVLAYFVSRGISRPIKACAQRLLQLSQGDLNTAVPTSNSKDEVGVMLGSLGSTTDFLTAAIRDIDHCLGEMAGGNLNVGTTIEFKGDFNQIKVSLDKILDALNDTLSQINQAADQVSSGSDQVSSGAQALSQGATEQASSVEELAATISEISQQVRDNADNARGANEQANYVGEEITVSNQKMQELIGAMSEISQSSQEIGKIIKTIEDIAFQTNILALNAAVEAARAGAAGRGFAVVADEVRNLASKSAEAAKGTTSLIEGAINAVANGTQLVDDTAKSLDSVVVGAKEVTTSIIKISTASSEQANAITQVTTGIDQISAVVQTNSATSEESAAASEELSSQATLLKNLVSRFKLRGMSDFSQDYDQSDYYPQGEGDSVQTSSTYTPYPPRAPYSSSSSKY